MKTAKQNVRRLIVYLAATIGLIVAMPAYSMVVYRHVPTLPSSSSLVHSNAVVNVEGSDQDVTAYDNFTFKKSASITSVAWRGTASSKSMVGFTIKIYPSNANPAAQPNIAEPLAEVVVTGSAGEKSVGNNLSDYHAEFNSPFGLVAGVQYWISIVSNRNDISPWGWASGTGGDAQSIQSFSEFKVLPAPSDRAFSLNDGRVHGRRR
ncbi:MAG: hypothetical protein HOO95_07025 [Gallionella sp.]|nr:hypothetical protein [Gallionella sp.]